MLALITLLLAAPAPAKGAPDCAIRCEAPRPTPTPYATGWARKRNHLFASGTRRHRARDLLLVEGEPQWALAKFAYGPFDKDLKGELVDVWLQRGCHGGWSYLGAGHTTRKDGSHPTVEGVVDKGGQLYFPIPRARRLGRGLHRLRLVVRGDRSSTDQWIHVVAKGRRVVVSDIDGTLTPTANAEVEALLRGHQSAVRPGAAAALRGLVARGFVPYYLSSRPDWLADRSHEWLAANGFPPGVVHVSQSKVGELRVDPADYKTAQLARLRQRGLVPALAFGDKATDARAWRDGGVAERWLIGLRGALHGGQTVDDWRALAPRLADHAAPCP